MTLSSPPADPPAGTYAGLASLSPSAPSSEIDADIKVDARFNVTALRPHVLVVDDESLIADSVVTILNRNGYDAVARYAGLEAIHYVQEYGPDIVITDVILPDLDGVRLALAVRALCPDVRVVLFSGNADSEPLMELALNDGLSFELLAKPVHPAQLLKALKAETNA